MLRIYKASAGSGKTYTLVREYLRLALMHREKFRHILAITFTNKAAAEMKSRIIEALAGISEKKEKYNSLTGELISLTGKPASELQTEAGILLRHMLHGYADISICTIDSFVHRIVRSFAYDLHLPMSFDIEMSKEKLLVEAVELLLDSLNEADPQVTQAVLEFAESKIEEGKGWNIEREIISLGNELFVDEALPHIGKLSFVSFDALRSARQSLYAKRTAIEQKLFAEGKKAFDLIVSGGYSSKDFYQSNRGLFGFFKSYAEESLPNDPLGNSFVRATVESNNWGKKSVIDEGTRQQLLRYYHSIIAIWEREGKDYYLADLLLKNFYSFILLTDLQKLLEELKSDNHLLHISDFQHKIYEIVRKQDAPVIYERIGDRYDNILIDEFQDTSVMQWRNLLPLIENSQFKGEDSLIVGDGKQAIYRFRGGEVEQFSVLPAVYGSEHDEILRGREIAINNYGVQVIPLEKNFRSRKEIIDFNNSLYKELLQLPELKNKAIYSDYQQEQGRNEAGGFVQIEFLKETQDDELSLHDCRCLRVKEIIDDVLQRGYSYGDVAVLTRSNSNASVIASYLVEQGIRVISPESLLIHHSPKVRLLLSALSYINRKDNYISRAEILHYTHLVQGKTFDYQTANAQIGYKVFEKQLEALTGCRLYTSELFTGRLSDLVQQLIQIFHFQDDDPFVQFFADEVLLFASRYGNNIEEFLQWWDEVKHKKSIIYPESLDAVRIMTIHKSKGLQFPVVILADADEKKKMTKNFFWVKLEKKWLPELNIGLLPRSEKIEQTEFAHLYERENEQSFLDMLNLFYVGTTRPEDALYILSSQTKEEPKENNSIVALLVSYLKQSSVWHGFTTYTFGDAGFTKATKAKKECSHLYIKEKTEFKNLLASNIQVKMRAELLWSDERTAGIDRGKQLHEALKFVRYRGDEEQAVEKMQAGGGLSESDKKNIIIKLKEITAHPEVAEYFSEGVTVINERALLKNDRKARFPDRIVLQNGSAVIIDYKTGNPLSKYAEQLNEYALLLNEAGIPVSRKIIFYTTAMKAEVLP